MSGRRRLVRRGPLARLDAELLPRLAGVARGMKGAGRTLGGATGPPGRLVGRAARSNPTISVALAAVVVAAALIVATGGDRHHAVASAPIPDAALPADRLGPANGVSVSTYLGLAAQRRNELEGSSAPEVTAVVDLVGYLTARSTASLLRGVHGVRMEELFARVAPPGHGRVHRVPVVAARQIGPALDRLAAAPSATRVEAGSRSEPKGLGATVGCVFALVVQGRPLGLLRLAADPEVRVLDPAPASAAAGLVTIVPLEPQVMGRVAPLDYARG